MKKNLLFMMPAMVFGTAVFGQATLTSANVESVAGEHIVMHTIYNETISPGDSGANQVWDYTAVPAGQSGNMAFLSCAAMNGCGNFGNANIIDTSLGVTGYYENTADAHRLWGLVAQGVTFTYTDPEDQLRYPFTYQNGYTDTFAASFYSGAQMYRTGYVTVRADGYGTVKTPSGIFTNALRLHFKENYGDSLGDPANMMLYSYVSDLYAWYVPGVHGPVFSISNLQTSLGGMTQSTNYYSYSEATPATSGIVDVNGKAVRLSVYPNPASGSVNIKIQDAGLPIREVTVYDLSGRKLMAPVSGCGTGHVTINTLSLAAGFYYASVTTDRGNENIKVEVVR